MRNSDFFKEAAIVANNALKNTRPFESIKYGVNKLRFIRKGYCITNNMEFSEEKFSKYAEHYEKLAYAMIKTYLEYKEGLK